MRRFHELRFGEHYDSRFEIPDYHAAQRESGRWTRTLARCFGDEVGGATVPRAQVLSVQLSFGSLDESRMELPEQIAAREYLRSVGVLGGVVRVIDWFNSSFAGASLRIDS